MTFRLLLTCLVVGPLLFCVPCHAQARVSQQASIAALQSPDPVTRANAFEDLRKTPGVFNSAGMSRILVDLLERENRLVQSTIRDSRGKVGIVDKYGEGFGEYLGDVVVECAAHCDMNDPHTILVIADAVPASNEFGEKLAAEHATVLLPYALEKAKTGDSYNGEQALVMLQYIAIESRTVTEDQKRVIDSALVASSRRLDAPLGLAGTAVWALGSILQRDRQVSPARKLFMHQAIISAASSPTTDTRIWAVKALGGLGDRSDLDLLREIAQRDAAQEVAGGKVSYPVRIEALKASAKISPR